MRKASGSASSAAFTSSSVKRSSASSSADRPGSLPPEPARRL